MKSASQGKIFGTPPKGQSSVMATRGGSDYQNAVLSWLGKVRSINLGCCRCTSTFWTWNSDRQKGDFMAFLLVSRCMNLKGLGVCKRHCGRLHGVCI